jgi:hypothetical protein
VAALLGGGGNALAQEAAPAATPSIVDAVTGGKLLLEARLRYESVDQAGIARTAAAATVRTRLGWETTDFHGFKGTMDFENISRVGPEHYNVAIPGPGGASLNGKTLYPIVNDPEVTELNRLQLAWTPNAAFGAVVGRQRVILDDQRFIGAVAWRQDEQTFDAARIDVAHGRLKATYVYIDKVNRVFGEDRDWDSDSHLLNATWSASEAVRLQGFVYALKFANSPANSTLTTGVKATGKAWAGLYQLAYGATYATEADYGNNAANFDLDYIEADLAATFDIWTLRAGYESLEGNGTLGFTTPLATAHAFNGWSDAFATAGGNKTHVDGLRDLNLTLTAQPRFAFAYWKNTQLIVRYHDFNAQRREADLASEIDLQLQAAITPKLTFLAKYADYDREEKVPTGVTLAPPDRRKAWVSLEYRF